MADIPITKAFATAELYARALRGAGVINTAWRKESSNVVCATTGGEGIHMMNMARDYRADVHLICETDGVREAGNLPDDIPEENHGPIYFNVRVHGLHDDPTGYGLPTHNAGKAGATLKEDIDDELQAIAVQAGLDI